MVCSFAFPVFCQEDATPENKATVPMDMIIYNSGTVFQGQIVEGQKTLIDDPNRYEIVLENGQTVSIEDTGQIETIKMDGLVLNDPLRHGGRGRLLEMIDDYEMKRSAERLEREKSRLTAKVGWVLGEPGKNTIGEDNSEILQTGTVVRPGEEIRTPSNARVQFRVASAFSVAMEQGALLKIIEIEFGENEKEIAFQIEVGRGNVWIEKEQSVDEDEKIFLTIGGLRMDFPYGLKRIRKSSNGDLTVTNYDGPNWEINRSNAGSDPVTLPRRTQARIGKLMLDGSRALKPEVTQVSDPIEWFEFTTWKPVEIDLPVEFTLTSHDRLQGRPVRPLMGVASDRFVFQDLQPVRVTGLAPLFGSYRQALEKFFVDTGRLPSSAEGLAVLRSASGEIEGWQGPYLKEEIPETDPWGNPFEYGVIQYEQKPLVNLYSIGENGIDEQGLGDDLR